MPGEMASDPSASDHVKSGPHVYFHVEFGISYSPRRHGKKHAVTYKSRNWRDQDRNDTRRVLVPSTHHLPSAEPRRDGQVRRLQAPGTETLFVPQAQLHSLAYPIPHPQAHSRPRPPLQPHMQPPSQSLPHHHPLPHPHPHPHPHPLPHPLPHYPRMPTSQVRARAPMQPSAWFAAPLQSGRPVRPETRSAPTSPALGPSHVTPWDAEPEPLGCSALPGGSRVDRDVFPAEPTVLPAAAAAAAAAATTTVTATASDDDDENAGGDSDAGTRTELEALSTAMMTVDNGFENQWWYQGEREVLPRAPNANTGRRSLDAVMPSAVAAAMSGFTPMPTTTTPVRRPTARSVGWAVAQQEEEEEVEEAEGAGRGFANFQGDADAVISPLSEVASPQRGPARIQRRLTTRSDELFFSP
ncbi:hypothetical protein SODALDRAFT_176197 [Sodiomyces alkalinus F11]|uniref:Uncharacterized protein n=1 Tax=Sodiomyces alkalinus (strain CBS 110278 / VKM F-3762 / F11) TaxID=1314773 RepID=A0A3N2PTP7_SODAK|nr:hypothetical protein SODALDRAFT_176197 [Sodiomyces alkalinus F11]ROT37880.1 hypothetical protein SODALDRAFT_176197 [Sodiomyces alkalinus F11]